MADLDTYDADQRTYEGTQNTNIAHLSPLRSMWSAKDFLPCRRRVKSRAISLTGLTSFLLVLTPAPTQTNMALSDDRDYPPRDRSRSPERDRDGDVRVRDEPANGRDNR